MTLQAAPGYSVRARALARSPRFRVAVRVVASAAVLVAIVSHVGTGPFLRAVLGLNPAALGAAMALTAIATAAAAWRWQLVARRLGVPLRWTTAVGRYYRSQFLNSVLPCGVLGDVHRAVEHGRQTGRAGVAARAIAVERTVGQVVQLALTVAVIVVAGARFARPLLPLVGDVLAGLAAAAVVSALASRRVRRILRNEARELRTGLGSVAVSAQAVAASLVVVCCQLATFAVATAAVGAGVPASRMPALAVVVLLAASIPVNVGGWGPREGVAGWAFALAGFGASAGVASASLFGILALLSFTPGVIVTALASLITRRTHRDRHPVRDTQLRHLARRLPRHGAPAETHAVEPRRLRAGG